MQRLVKLGLLTSATMLVGCGEDKPCIKKPVETYTDGPVPLTEEEFADLQAKLRKEIAERDKDKTK